MVAAVRAFKAGPVLVCYFLSLDRTSKNQKPGTVSPAFGISDSPKLRPRGLGLEVELKLELSPSGRVALTGLCW